MLSLTYIYTKAGVQKNSHKADIADMVLRGGEGCMVGVRSKQLSKCPNLFQAATVEPDRAHTNTHTLTQTPTQLSTPT